MLLWQESYPFHPIISFKYFCYNFSLSQQATKVILWLVPRTEEFTE